MPFDPDAQKRIRQIRLDHLEFVFGFELQRPIDQRVLAELHDAFTEDGWEETPETEHQLTSDELLTDFHDFTQDYLQEHLDTLLTAYVRDWSNTLRDPKTRKFTKPMRLWLIESRRRDGMEKAA